MASERQEADRAEALRVAQAERAIVEQRGRLARELHDVVAHSISVMVVQATAAEGFAARAQLYPGRRPLPQDVETFVTRGQ